MKGPHKAAGNGDWPLALPLLSTFLPLQIQVRKAAVAYEVWALLLGGQGFRRLGPPGPSPWGLRRLGGHESQVLICPRCGDCQPPHTSSLLSSQGRSKILSR